MLLLMDYLNLVNHLQINLIHLLKKNILKIQEKKKIIQEKFKFIKKINTKKIDKIIKQINLNKN